MKMRLFALIPIILTIAWPVASIFFAGLSTVIYLRLSDDIPIAKLYFQQQTPKVYKAYFIEEDAEHPVEYKIFGDQWYLDVQFIKFKPWANILGLDAQYKLERFKGRYKSISDENTYPHRAYNLNNNFIKIPEFMLDYNFFIDAEYGSSTYQSIDTTKLYTVYRTQSGVIVRQQPLPQELLKEEDLFNKFNKFFN